MPLTHRTLTAFALLLSGCSGPKAELFPREPRRPEEEGWIAPAEPIAMAQTPEQEQRERLSAQGRMNERREKGGTGSSHDVFGEGGVRSLISDLEGVWLVRELQFPSRTRPVTGVDGIAVATGDYLHLLLLGQGQSERGFETVFQSGAYRMRPDISGKIDLQSQGGFSNLGPFIRSIEEKRDERDRALDPRPQSQVGTNQDPPQIQGLTPGMENPYADLNDLVDLRFYGKDRVRLEREQNFWVELERKTTNRLLAERQTRFLEKLRVDDPDGKRPMQEVVVPRAVETQRVQKRDLQGHWAVVELHNAKKDPTKNREGGGYFTFLDGVLIYQLTQPVKYSQGRVSTGFQLGVRRYAVTEGSELMLEDTFGVLSVEGTGSYGVRRLPAGHRSRMKLVFEDDMHVRLEHDLDDYIRLERIARPQFVSKELAAEQDAPAKSSPASTKHKSGAKPSAKSAGESAGKSGARPAPSKGAKSRENKS